MAEKNKFKQKSIHPANWYAFVYRLRLKKKLLARRHSH